MKVNNLQLGDEALIALRDIGHGAAREKQMLALTCVCIEVTRSHVWAVVTNSYLLVLRHIVELSEAPKETFRVLIPAKPLSAAAKASYRRPKDARRRARKDALTRSVTISSEGIELQTDDGTVSVGAEKEFAYPDIVSIVDSLVKKDPEPRQHVCFNPAFVAQVGRALGATEMGLQFEFMGGLLDPALVGSIPDERSVGLLMPIRDKFAIREARRLEEKRQREEEERHHQEQLAQRRKKDRARRAAKRKAA